MRLIFFIVNVFQHTTRKTSWRDVEAPETLESFKVSASVSEAAMSRLSLISDFKGLVSDKILNVSISSRSQLRRSRANPCFTATNTYYYYHFWSR